MSPFFQGLSCIPTTNPADKCVLGGYSNYVLKATSVSDIQIAVNLARNLNMRLVVKNTGTFSLDYGTWKIYANSAQDTILVERVLVPTL